MKVVKWIVLGLVAMAYLAPGVMKLVTPYAEMIVEPAMAWASDFSETQVKIIGVLEILGVVGLVLPLFLKKYYKLVPISALALSCLMVGAIITHVGREEAILMNIVILLLTLLTFWWHKDWMKKAV